MAFENGADLVAPEQARHRDRIRRSVGPLRPKSPEDDGSVGRAAGRDDTPPIRQKRHGLRKVTLVGDQGRPIDDAAIGLDLSWQAVEAVRLGLDLDPTDVAVDDRDVDARGAVGEAEFVDDQGVRRAGGMRQEATHRRRSQVSILQPRFHCDVMPEAGHRGNRHAHLRRGVFGPEYEVETACRDSKTWNCVGAP